MTQPKARAAPSKRPLTPEYQAVHEASIADQKAGARAPIRTYLCLRPAMPRLITL